MPPQGSTTPRARHAAPARHGRPGSARRGDGGRGGRGGRGLGRAGVLALVVLAVLLVGGGGAAIAMMAVGTTTGSSGSDASSPTSPTSGSSGADAPGAAGSDADAGLPTSPTMLASITSVPAGDEVVVDVAGRSIPVHILGIAAPEPGQCGAEAALAYANQKLSGQMVTLVPDPTMPETDPQGRRLAYVVLRTQLSYTDDALMKGMARADTSRPLWYSEVFAREQSTAVDDAVGIWGAPCRAKP